MRDYDADDRAIFHATLRRWATAFALLRDRCAEARRPSAEIPNAWHDRVSLPQL